MSAPGPLPERPPIPSATVGRHALAMLRRGRLKAAPWALPPRALIESWMDPSQSHLLDLTQPPVPHFDRDEGPDPLDEPTRAPTRATAFSSEPWGGRVGIVATLPLDPSRPGWVGLWRLDQPSPDRGPGFPFFRMGDFAEAEQLWIRILAWTAPNCPRAARMLAALSSPFSISKGTCGLARIQPASQALAAQLALEMSTAAPLRGGAPRRI